MNRLSTARSLLAELAAKMVCAKHNVKGCRDCFAKWFKYERPVPLTAQEILDA